MAQLTLGDVKRIINAIDQKHDHLTVAFFRCEEDRYLAAIHDIKFSTYGTKNEKILFINNGNDV